MAITSPRQPPLFHGPSNPPRSPGLKAFLNIVRPMRSARRSENLPTCFRDQDEYDGGYSPTRQQAMADFKTGLYGRRQLSFLRYAKIQSRLKVIGRRLFF